MKNISGNVRKKRYESTISWEYRIHNKRICAGSFPESEVFIMGNSLLKTERKKHLNVRPFPERDEELEDIFHTYDFELMVYFSNYITFHGTMEGEAEKLRKVLSYCKRSKEIHVIYLTGPEAGYAATTGKTLLVRGAENLCCQYGKCTRFRSKS